MKSLVFTGVLALFVGLHVCPPVEKASKVEQDGMYMNTDGMNETQAQEVEYYRYLTQVVQELEKDENFKASIQNVTEEDIRTGKIAELYDLVGHNIRGKLDEIKRKEVEYQRDLLRQRKHHMADHQQNYWNPMHHGDGQESFGKEDIRKLLNKHNDMIAAQDEIREKEFKHYELEKEHKRREAMKNMTVEEKKVEEKHHEEVHHRPHEKLHEPGHKAQLEQVWEQEDGFDADSFDLRTFFSVHDKNSDGYLDYFELETFFLNDLNKAYNESDPETDMYERDEEINRMREHVMKTMDTDRDGLVSKAEFLAETEGEDFEKDEEWKPLKEDDQFTESELDEYEKHLIELASTGMQPEPEHPIHGEEHPIDKMEKKD